MINVYYAENEFALTADESHSPEKLKMEYWQRKFLCRRLLIKALISAGYSGHILRELKYNRYNRPYLEIPNLDFNISHSGRIIICAISNQTKLGIDIEIIKDTSITDFYEFLSDDEIYEISSVDNPLRAFYRTWTRKEAVIKANGKGLNLPLSRLNSELSVISIENKQWYLQEIEIHSDYSCHLATEFINLSTNIEFVHL